MSESPGMDMNHKRHTWHIFTRLTLGAVLAAAVVLALMAAFLT